MSKFVICHDEKIVVQTKEIGDNDTYYQLAPDIHFPHYAHGVGGQGGLGTILARQYRSVVLFCDVLYQLLVSGSKVFVP